jgi:hypothetical protein
VSEEAEEPLFEARTIGSRRENVSYQAETREWNSRKCRRENVSERDERFEVQLQKDLGMSVTRDETCKRSSRKSRQSY